MRIWRVPLLSAVLSCSLALAASGAAGETRTITLDRGAQDPAVSPDGTQVAVGILGRIWIVPIQGGDATQVTEGLGWDTHPAWSPDGRFICYSHQLPGGTDLVERNMSTGGTRVVYHTDAGIGQIAYHPRGGELFYLLDKSQLDCHLWRIPLEGGQPRQLTFTQNWHEWSFALSPEGEEILLDSGRFGGSNLYRISLKDLSAQRLTRTPLYQFSVAWSGDGKTLAYIESENGIDSVMVQPAAGGTPRRIFASAYDQKQLALEPGGSSSVLCAARRLYRLDHSSGNLTPLSFTARLALPAPARPDLVIRNARLVAAPGSAPIANATVVIRDGRIASASAGAPPETLTTGMPVLDAGGKTVLAGLMDNHYHYWNAFDGADLLARGVTTIRDVGTAVSTTMNFREAIDLGLLPGPRMYVTGPLIDGPGDYHPLVDVELNKKEAAAGLVRALKAQGVDLLKVYFLLDPEVLEAVVKEGHALGLRSTGHIGVRTGWREAMERGIDGLCHLRVWRDFLPLDRQPQGDNESLDGGKNPVARMQADWSEIDPEGEGSAALIQMMIQRNVGFDPTLAIQRIDDDQRKSLSIEQFNVARSSYKRMADFVARANRMGVLLLAGTDNVNLFDELEAYAEAGIPNNAILASATVNGARWLGKEAEFGTIEAGKRADLIMVDGDPMADAKNFRKVLLVVKDGRIVYRK